MSRKSTSRKLEATLTPRQPELPQRGRREPVPGASPQRWVLGLVPVLIALVTFAAFLPTLQNQFVNWDDADNFLDNPYYRGLGWSQLRWMWTTFHMGHWIPLTWMTLGLDYRLWGMNPVGYHLTSLVLHAANAIVFYFVAVRILGMALPDPSGRRRANLALAAAFAALLFALHPLRVESVAWATERRDVLSGLFYLLTILVYLRARERGERGRGWYWGAVGLFACALLSKSITVSLPIVLLILDVYPLGRLGGATGWWSRPARRVYQEKIPFVLLAGGAAAVAFLALFQLHNMAVLDRLSVPGRLAISAYNLSFYLWKMVVPVTLSPLYELGRVNPSATPFLLSYGAVLAITALALAVRHRVPGLPVAWLAYVIILLPVLGIFQNGPQVAADRYTYLAGMGWALLAGAGLLSASRRLPVLSTGLALALLVGLGFLTWIQTRVWHDSETLWSHAVAIDPGSPLGEYSWGLALDRQGKVAEAIDRYQAALRLNPNYADAHNSVGAALANQGKVAEAIEHYQTALRLKPDFAEAHGNLGAALAQQGALAEAIDHYRRALHIKPDYADAHGNWGNALAQQGKLAEANDHYRQAVQIKFDYADAHFNWGNALAQQGELAEAIAHYRQALQIKPDSAQAHTNWGNALAQQGNLVEAIAQYQQALQIRPDHASARANLHEALRARDMGKEDIAHNRGVEETEPRATRAR
jgi:tetratricopeptide (TPR) repeat protein